MNVTVSYFLVFATGALIVFLLLTKRSGRAKREVMAERARADTAAAESHRFEVDLAATRPEANRATHLGIRLGELNDINNGLEARCASLATKLEEREKATADEKSQLHADREELRGEIARLTAKVNADCETIQRLAVEKSSLAASIAEREDALRQERAQLGEMGDLFRAQFAELSANALKDNSESFLETAKRVLALQHLGADTDLAMRQEEIKLLVQPLQDGIKAVSDAARDMESRREKTFGTIEEQLRQSVLHSAEVARQAGALKDALKRPTVRGRWGEVQLMNCIELAGMEEHCDVKYQQSSTSGDDNRVRPDMEVMMPGGRRIVVDSKTPLEHFLQYIDAVSDEDRNIALVKHAKGVKSHINDLAKVDYMQKVAGSPDFVVMFLPNESFLAMALEKDPSLMQDALDRKVLIATPGTLIGLLKVVRYGWNEQKQTESARKIAEEGAKLNTELVSFLLDFAKLGQALRTASDTYEDSVRRVRKQITSSSQRLTTLGARSRKKLSAPETRLLSVGPLEHLDVDEAETMIQPWEN